MKKTTPVFFSVFCMLAATAVHAQHDETPQPFPERTTVEKPLVPRTYNNLQDASNVVWSEDFANGIPSDWINQGYRVVSGNVTPAAAYWEYRGPNTSPTLDTGSIGLYSGSGPTITCLTKSNGYIIFDSDLWDTGGKSGARGNGPVPAPHYGTLTTDTIDLSAHQNVLVSLYSRARNQRSAFKIAVSNNGGITFADTFDVHPGLPSNTTANTGAEITFDISAAAGGEPYVVLQLLFDGNQGDGTNGGLYYWQVDDIEIRSVPKNEFKFVAFGGAPANDIIYPPNTPEYGHPQIDQAVPILFDSNILNFGTNNQTNVKLKVDVKDASGTIVTSLSSPTMPVLASGDTGTYIDFNTTAAWTPSAVGDYWIVFSVESDSIPLKAASPKDSIPIRVGAQRYGAHFGRFNNDIGTDQSRAALAQVYTFPNSHPDSAGYVLIDEVRTYVSTASDVGGELYVEIYDTTGFTYGASGGPVGTPYATASYIIASGDPGTWVTIDMTTNGDPLVLEDGKGYMVVINLYPATPGETIQLGNDQTVGLQPSGMAAMQRDDGYWFRSYSGSLTMATPMIELTTTAVQSINLPELRTSGNIKLYPQPAVGKKVNIEIPQAGHYNVQVLSTNGQVLLNQQIDVNHGEVLQRDFNMLPQGNYVLRIFNDEYQFVEKMLLK